MRGVAQLWSAGGSCGETARSAEAAQALAADGNDARLALTKTDRCSSARSQRTNLADPQERIAAAATGI